FSVPTGNFGNIFAGYLAKKLLGYGIDKLILATNENDILARFVNNGDYSVREVIPTISPAMDIQIASNFERYLYYFYEEDSKKTALAMDSFAKNKRLTFTEEEIKRVQKDFWACSVSQSEILETIRITYEKWGYILDPHTAVGVRAALSLKDKKPIICLSTAHPAKFPETVRNALQKDFPLPKEIEELKIKPQKYEIFEGETEKIKGYLSDKALL
ncbi:MAG: threonine synthase, partial [Caldimicrobium sp.]